MTNICVFRRLKSLFLLLFSLILFASPGVILADYNSDATKIISNIRPNPKVYNLALKAYNAALSQGIITKKQLLTVVDYSLPSNVERLWLIDLENQKILSHTLVAHGMHSGIVKASQFSNNPESWQSSLGLYLTEDAYFGKHGYSLRLKGLEPHFNDHAEARAVVVHGAPYVSQEFMLEHGRLGRSWGCITVNTHLAKKLIDQIKGGTLLFVYYPDSTWLANSRFLNYHA